MKIVINDRISINIIDSVDIPSRKEYQEKLYNCLFDMDWAVDQIEKDCDDIMNAMFGKEEK